ncbi:MAG: hypothetical protein IJ214_12090, partial [Clostridia bacterium]|nr:hypothetical protein [Clostridia bacterium]
GQKKTRWPAENKFTYFPVCPAGFRCALCAQHARLCRAARQRWQASLLLFAAVAFMATNAALSGSLSGSERERPRSYPFLVKFVLSDVLLSSGLSMS